VVAPSAKLYPKPSAKGAGPAFRPYRRSAIARIALLVGLSLAFVRPDTPAARLYSYTLVLAACVGLWLVCLWLVSAWRAPLVAWLYLPFDMTLLALLIRGTGGVESPFVSLGYVWFFGALFYLRQGHAGALPLVAALPLGAVALGSWGGAGWGLELGAHALCLGVAALLGRLFLAERAENRVDPLTRALTRRHGTEQLTAWLDAGTPFSVAFLDLHGFKATNDRYGHGVGDEVLSAVALRLGRATRQGDLVMRYGGDEFVVASRAPALAARLSAALAAPAQTSVGELPLRVDIGGATWNGGETLLSLLGRADAAMYRAKAAAKSGGTPRPPHSGAPTPTPQPGASRAGAPGF